jgi:GT2 family glycosyltransferase
MSSAPSISVIVCSDGRAAALANLHAALAHQHNDRFEIVYIIGPTEDGAWEAVERWAGQAPLKYARCSEHNLSMARNMGLALAAGDLVAFIDDDALPEPEWLVQLSRMFADPHIAGASGAVIDFTGVDYQFRFSAADRFGRSHHLDAPFEDGAYPLSPLFPHAMGANCMFRREALSELGGFDEEYDYYLDETDLCCRLIDEGWTIAQAADAPVHHKFLPSRLRDAQRVLIAKYPVLKNKLYYALVNNRGHATMDEIMADAAAFFARHRADLEQYVARGQAPKLSLAEFDADVEKAWRVGLARGLSGERRLRVAADFAAPPPFAVFPTRTRAAAPRTFALLASADSPREAEAHAFAAALAALGHDVHLILGGAEYEEADLIDGVWVRRRAMRYAPLSAPARAAGLSEPLWRIYANVDAELQRLAEFRRLDAVIDLSAQGLSIGALWRGAPNLIVHEVIGAGDAFFIERARKRAKAAYTGSRITIMASHANGVLKDFCNKGLWLEQGRIVDFGPIDEVVERYEQQQARFPDGVIADFTAPAEEEIDFPVF